MDDMALLDDPQPIAAPAEAPAEADAADDAGLIAEAAPDADAAPEGDAASLLEIEFPEPEPDAEAEGEEGAEFGDGSDGARYGTRSLTRLIEEHPELKKAIEAAGAKSHLYQLARRSQQLSDYQQVLPSVGQAREAAEARQAMSGWDTKYFADNPEAFWQDLHAASGATGSYERHVQWLHQEFLKRLGQRPELSAAVEAIRGVLATPRAEDGKAAVELKALRSQLAEREQQAQRQFLDDTAAEAARGVSAFVNSILEKSGFSDYERAHVTRDFLEAVERAGRADAVHNAALEELLRGGGRTAATRAALARRTVQWARQHGRDLLEPILRRAGAGLAQRQARAEQARAAARPEPASSGRPAAPVLPHGRDLVRQREHSLGRKLSDREILDLA